MSWFPIFVKCGWCGKYDEKPRDQDVPTDWFFVARPRAARGEERVQHEIPTPTGIETITVEITVDRWLFCSDDCLAHVGDVGTTEAVAVDE